MMKNSSDRFVTIKVKVQITAENMPEASDEFEMTIKEKFLDDVNLEAIGTTAENLMRNSKVDYEEFVRREKAILKNLES